MLSERVQELLSAAVDGELTARQREAVDQLLGESAEARALYCEMKRDAERLQHMRRIRLSQDFPAVILKRVAEKKPAPNRGLSPIARWMPVWANTVAAAAVILAICGATTLVVIWNEQQKKAGIAKENKNLPEKAPAPRLIEPPVAVKPANNGADNARVEKLPFPPSEVVVETVTPSPIIPQEPKKPGLGSPGSPSVGPLTQIPPPKLSPIIAMKDLDLPAERQKLIDALRADPMIQIDLFCKDSAKASEKLQKAFGGQKVLVDAVAQECQRLKVAKVQYLFYVEHLTPDEIDRVLQAVAAEDRKSEKQLDKLVLHSLVPSQLKPLLGVEPKWLQTKSLPAKPFENLVLVLVSNGKVTSNPATSKDIKHFVETRREKRPGSVPVLISVREPE
ncbi:MAG TPA: hypothetical protein VKS79_09295 [Gemmataceae bacterium]|nr:hypothetical protein [Gemmataceae bacterium]